MFSQLAGNKPLAATPVEEEMEGKHTGDEKWKMIIRFFDWLNELIYGKDHMDKLLEKNKDESEVFSKC
jgi:hypothetical protein